MRVFRRFAVEVESEASPSAMLSPAQHKEVAMDGCLDILEKERKNPSGDFEI